MRWWMILIIALAGAILVASVALIIAVAPSRHRDASRVAPPADARRAVSADAVPAASSPPDAGRDDEGEVALVVRLCGRPTGERRDDTDRDHPQRVLSYPGIELIYQRDPGRPWILVAAFDPGDRDAPALDSTDIARRLSCSHSQLRTIVER